MKAVIWILSGTLLAGTVTPLKAGDVDPAVARKARVPADQPVPRTDNNSRIAHEQLLEKASKGTIDVYFVGDSITRRLGATDYPELLALWNETFYGWNAANFAWGGDNTRNILWRMDNGELEGVQPKVYVILAGTNNLGERMSDEEKTGDITAGIRAIVDRCRKHSPDAAIILTAIFPRNDNMALLPVINGINQNIAQFADGKTIRFLDVNGKLAGADGMLFEGVMMDRLHPTKKGYELWTAGLTPILTELLGPPARTDHAPPPTGDPSAQGRTPKQNSPAAPARR